MPLVINLLIVLMFMGLGILFRKGKGDMLIAGYNTMNQAEKSKIDEKKLCKYMARLMFVLAACWLVLAIGLQLSWMWLFWLGFALFIGAAIGFALYINTGNRIQK